MTSTENGRGKMKKTQIARKEKKMQSAEIKLQKMFEKCLGSKKKSFPALWEGLRPRRALYKNYIP